MLVNVCVDEVVVELVVEVDMLLDEDVVVDDELLGINWGSKHEKLPFFLKTQKEFVFLVEKKNFAKECQRTELLFPLFFLLRSCRPDLGPWRRGTCCGVSQEGRGSGLGNVGNVNVCENLPKHRTKNEMKHNKKRTRILIGLSCKNFYTLYQYLSR